MSKAFTNYLREQAFAFKGRASAREFWHFFSQIAVHVMIAVVVLAACKALTSSAKSGPDGILWFRMLLIVGGIIAFLAFAFPVAALAVRRMHDLNRSGWWLLPLILGGLVSPIAPWAIFAITLFTLVKSGQPHANNFGEVSAFDKETYLTPLQLLWRRHKVAPLAMAACLAGLGYVGFYSPHTDTQPKSLGDGRSEYYLIDRQMPAAWALILPDNRLVRPSNVRFDILPSFGGRQPTKFSNGELVFDLTESDLGLSLSGEKTVRVHLVGDPTPRAAWRGGQTHRNCKRGEEIADNVYIMRGTTRLEAELEYERRAHSGSFEEFFERQSSLGCTPNHGRIHAKYQLIDEQNSPLAYGNCFTEEKLCKFATWLPFERQSWLTVAEEDFDKIAAIRIAVVRYLWNATNRAESTNIVISDLEPLEPAPFDPDTFVPTPSFTTVVLDPADIPSQGFLQVIFDGDDPDTVVHQSTAPRIAMRHERSGFQGVPPKRFAAYWVAKRTFEEPTRQRLAFDRSGIVSTVRINGKTVYVDSRRVITGRDITAALDNPIFDNGTHKVAALSAGPRPENPFVFDFEAGENFIEVEYVNDHHTINFTFEMGDPIAPLTRGAVKAALDTVAAADDAEVFYFGVHGSPRPDERIDINLPPSDQPAILILDSFRTAGWTLDTDRPVAATIVSSAAPTTSLRSGDWGKVLHLNKPINMHDETRDCKCNRGSVRCGSKKDVIDLANTILSITGRSLSGYHMEYESGFMRATPYNLTVRDRIQQVRTEFDALHQTCS